MQSNKGFTLIEIFFVVLFMSIALFFAMPFGFDFFYKNQEKILIKSLKEAVLEANMNAILEGVPFVLAGINEDWSAGLIMYRDTYHHRLNREEDILFTWKFRRGTHLEWHGFQSNERIIFSKEPSEARSNGTWTYSIADKIKGVIHLNRHGVFSIDIKPSAR